MEIIKSEVELIRYQPDEIPPSYQELISEAQQALLSSYSPYSEFAVGAAILLDDGSIIQGSNQENAAYPSGLCAERTALFFAGASKPKARVKAIAVTVQRPIGRFPFPCGSCLQVMAEVEEKQGEPLDIIMVHPESSEILLSKGLKNLLPNAFNKSHLRK